MNKSADKRLRQRAGDFFLKNEEWDIQIKEFLRLESVVREQLESLVLHVCVAVRLRTPGMGVHNPAGFPLMDVGKEVGRCEKERKQQQQQSA